MNFTKQSLFSKNNITTVFVLVIIALMMTAPVLANSSRWQFTGTVWGEVVDGKANGVLHYMTAGNLTNSGSLQIYQQSSYPTVEPWYVEVRKDAFFNPLICKSNAITPTTSGKSFTVNCGSISSGNYYLRIYRDQTDGRAVAGSGHLTTP